MGRNKNIVVDGEVLRPCKLCKRLLPLSSFNTNKKGAWVGLDYRCRECANDMHRELYSGKPHLRRGVFSPEKRDSLRKHDRDYYAKTRDTRLEKKRVDGLTPKGKERRTKRKLAAYGLTIEAYEKLLASQGGRCAICETDTFMGKNWCVDHAHDDSKIVRAILCTNCNSAFGLIKESSRIAANLLKYAEKWEKLRDD